MRVTQKMLKAKVHLLNNLLDRPSEPCNHDTLEWNVGHIHLSEDGVGITIAEVKNTDGATGRPFTTYSLNNHECAIVLDSLCSLAQTMNKPKTVNADYYTEPETGDK